MVNNWSKLALNCETFGSDKLSDLSCSGGKMGHVDGDLVEVNRKVSFVILRIVEL